jgi:hypothetical protein
MPKIKIGARRKGPKEKLDEIRNRQKEKKGKGEKLTIEALEERIEALEELVEKSL